MQEMRFGEMIEMMFEYAIILIERIEKEMKS